MSSLTRHHYYEIPYRYRAIATRDTSGLRANRLADAKFFITNSLGWYGRRYPPMSAPGLGRVKTPMFNRRIEIPSRFRQFENQKCLRLLLGEDDRENNSAHFWRVHVFTQPGSFSTEWSCPRHVRFAPDSDQTADMASGPVRAMNGPGCFTQPPCRRWPAASASRRARAPWRF
jgi:hypothetical protein